MSELHIPTSGAAHAAGRLAYIVCLSLKGSWQLEGNVELPADWTARATHQPHHQHYRRAYNNQSKNQATHTAVSSAAVVSELQYIASNRQ